MDQAIEEGARGQHHCRRRQFTAIARAHANHPGAVQEQILGPAFHDFKICGCQDCGLHRLPVQLAVSLSARPLYGGTLGAVQHPELNASSIGDAAHQTVESIDFTDQMPLAEAADGRVARHFANGRETVGDQGSARAHSSRRRRCFTARMAAADHNHVK